MDIRFEIRGEPANVKIEPMILIPLVENSFKHCDFDTNPAAYAHFSLEIKGDHLVFTTQNTVNTINRQKDKVGGVGLSNINKRLSLKYPEDFQFKTTSTENTFEVYLKFPVEV
jgi:LytS/YehU family sensor histidine kinase